MVIFHSYVSSPEGMPINEKMLIDQLNNIKHTSEGIRRLSDGM